MSNDNHWSAPGCPPGSSPAVGSLLSRLGEAMTDAASLSMTGLNDADVTAVLDAATRAAAQIARVQALAAAEADHRQLGEIVGARHTKDWWSTRSNLTRPEAGRLINLGHALTTPEHTPVANALAEGELRQDQAQAIVKAVAAIPTCHGPDVRSRARDHLLEAAAEHDSYALARLGKRILDVVAPEVGQSHEQRLLEAEERAAQASAHLTMFHDTDGRSHGRFTLPTLTAKMLEKQLFALANPRRHDESDLKNPDTGLWRPTPERLGQAWVELIERVPADLVPHHGGVNATVVVTIDHDALVSGVGVATLDDGSRLSAGAVRRLACEAGLIPAVLDGKSQILDLGRTGRFHNTAQRLALAVRDRGCTAKWCTMPPAACHAHHDTPWSRGGGTNLTEGRLLCPRHHRLAHHSGYHMRRDPDNKVTFHRRT